MLITTFLKAASGPSPRRCDGPRRRVVSVLVVCVCAASGAQAQGTAAPARGAVAPAQAAMPPAQHIGPVHPSVQHRQQKQSPRAGNYYTAAWGVQDLNVRYTASGNLIRFSYRVADPALAKVLADKGATPYLLGQRSRALLQVPVMEKVGPLRQSSDPLAGKEYWMVFSNKGNLVRPGDRVNVMIGAFHADGLLVE
jgi:hypothetical protein